jgi:hypothetical protein
MKEKPDGKTPCAIGGSVQRSVRPTDWKLEFESAKAAYEREYKKTWDLCEAANKYLANDGSQGQYDALALDGVRKELVKAIDAGMRDQCEPEPDADMGRMEHDDCGDN